MTYLDSGPGAHHLGHSWADHTAQRLLWQYGEARARQILSGADPNTQRDIAAWNRLRALAGERVA